MCFSKVVINNLAYHVNEVWGFDASPQRLVFDSLVFFVFLYLTNLGFGGFGLDGFGGLGFAAVGLLLLSFFSSVICLFSFI